MRGNYFLEIAILSCATSVLAQPAVQPGRPVTPSVPIVVPGSTTPQPPPAMMLNRRVSEEDAAAYRKARAEYDECRRVRAGAVRLTEAADNVILVRDRRAFWDSEIKRNSSMRLQYPGGYGQMLARGFEEYRAAGGTAGNVDAVRPVPAPCKQPMQPSPRGPSPVTDTKRFDR